MRAIHVALYFKLFWAPALASAYQLAMLLAQGSLSNQATALLSGWFVLAFALQMFFSASSPFWIAGLVLQTALALFLILKKRLERL